MNMPYSPLSKIEKFAAYPTFFNIVYTLTLLFNCSNVDLIVALATIIGGKKWEL